MRYVSAYLLAVLGGNDSPSLSDLQKILGSVGIDCEDEKANKVIGSLKGKSIEELIEQGKEKLASVPSGGAAVAASAGTPAAGAPAAEKADEKEEKKEEEEEESDEDMGFGLFD